MVWTTIEALRGGYVNYADEHDELNFGHVEKDGDGLLLHIDIPG